MDVALQNSEAWLGTLNDDIMRKCASIQLIGGDGLSTFVPMHFLTATSSFFKSVISDSCSWVALSSDLSISIPSATITTLQHVVEILYSGEIKMCSGLQLTLEIMEDVHNVLFLLGVDIRFGPKVLRSRSKNIWNEEVSSILSSTPFSSPLKPRSIVSNQGILELSGENLISPLQKCQRKAKQRGLMKMFTVAQVRESMNEKNVNTPLDSYITRDDVSESGKNVKESFQGNAYSGEEFRNLKCLDCGYSFTTKTALSRHIRNKSCNLNPAIHKCLRCSLRFRSMTSVKRHLLKIHKEVYDAANSESSMVNPVLDSNFNRDSSVALENSDTTPINHKEKLELFVDSPVSKRRKTQSENKGIRMFGCGGCNYVCKFRYRVRKHCSAKGHDSSLLYEFYDLPIPPKM